MATRIPCSAFPKPHAWSIYLRRALLALPAPDVELLDRLLKPLLVTRAEALASYSTPRRQTAEC